MVPYRTESVFQSAAFYPRRERPCIYDNINARQVIAAETEEMRSPRPTRMPRFCERVVVKVVVSNILEEQIYSQKRKLRHFILPRAERHGNQETKPR